ncbi:uncharacterized protein PHACADRAFT_131814 [Phanerochaete carnosa HHB-10118-sp]|uniref:SHSP domain-containing protein n=1 Tax=Phanerochaete carnosa (strain HHB-10118-sp) TaxID=650164 RepID=K5VE80_PHACS|nr:uncharacterized protein PHACADRAFT_131814 [Phanerochaete carnosa HHB-10118-sp]EKM49443.1 hypothetical protein PHACADRAFT_131814 [Phanerochaete carnosa HHB-10118-sp]
MDLYDDEALPNVSAMLELPGVNRHTLSLQVQGDKLIVQGERASPLASKLQEAAAGRQTSVASQKFKVRELKFGSFRREIDVPTTQITAELCDGILLISWPRASDFSMGRSNARPI